MWEETSKIQVVEPQEVLTVSCRGDSGDTRFTVTRLLHPTRDKSYGLFTFAHLPLLIQDKNKGVSTVIYLSLSLNTGREGRSFHCGPPPSLYTGREGRNFHCYPPPSPGPGRRWETHCHKPVNKEKRTPLRIKTLYSTHWGSLCFLGYRFLFLLLFSLTIILLVFCHGPFSP
jgi:hypothetical protein